MSQNHENPPFGLYYNLYYIISVTVHLNKNEENIKFFKKNRGISLYLSNGYRIHKIWENKKINLEKSHGWRMKFNILQSI